MRSWAQRTLMEAKNRHDNFNMKNDARLEPRRLEAKYKNLVDSLVGGQAVKTINLTDRWASVVQQRLSNREGKVKRCAFSTLDQRSRVLVDFGNECWWFLPEELTYA